MIHIYNFCKDAERIFGSTTNIKSLKTLTIEIHPEKDEIYRTRHGKNNCIFDFQLGYNTSIQEEIKLMKTIELFYPNTFTWRFNGKHIEALAKIYIVKENLGKFRRYGSIFDFIVQLRKRLMEVLKYRGQGVEYQKEILHDIISTGSINFDTKIYVINIKPSHTFYDILKMSSNREIKNVKIKELDMGFWIKEINPDFFKKAYVKKTKKYSLTNDIFKKYPVCINNIAKLKKKGNYNRFLLATFLLGVHNERDAKHQLDIMLTEKERDHINNGDCKDQWRTILVKGYSPPGCKSMVECGHCLKDCGRAAPILLEKERGENNG